MLALAGVSQRLLGGGFGDADALHADRQPRAVHHGEHAGHAGILFADQKADGAAFVAENHGAGRRAVDAELVLDRMGAHVIALARRAVGIGQEFRHQEQRNAPRAGRRIGQACQHEVNDVFGEIVLAVGDEDFLPFDAVGAVGCAFGAGAQRADVGAGLRLGELHGAGPFAGHHFLQVNALELFAAVGVQRIDRRDGQQRADGKRHGRGIPHFDAGDVDRLRQRLAAPFHRRREPVPAAIAPGFVGFLPAGRGGDDTVLERRAERVADPIERRDDLAGEAAGFGQHRLDHIHGEIAEQPLVERG